MTEIPEHLLKRAAERRAAMGQGGDAAASEPAAGSEAAPASDAPAKAATPAKAEPAPIPSLEDAAPAPEPDIPVVAAAKARRRIPYWAAPVLALLPLWGIIYVASVQPPPAGANDPLVIGKDVYTANCASCHKPDGSGVKSGGTGQQLNDGEVLKTFADPLSMVYWIHYGAEQGARPDRTYGDLSRPGGPHTLDTLPSAAMPPFQDLSPEEMAAVVIYVREELSGGDPADDPNFNVDTFKADPTALADMVDAVTALEPNNPDAVSSVDGAEG